MVARHPKQSDNKRCTIYRKGELEEFLYSQMGHSKWMLQI